MEATRKYGVLRAYVLIVSVIVATFVVLRAVHIPLGIVEALVVLACVAALFASKLTGPTEYVQVSSLSFEQRIQNRYRSESGAFLEVGFTPLFCCGEAFPLARLLLVYPAFLFLIMLLNREVATVQNGSKLCFGFPVFISSDRTTYAHPLQLGTKFQTRFQDGTILMTKSFGGKKQYGPMVVVRSMANASISETWAEHQKEIRALEAIGKQVDREISFQTYSDIQCEA